MTKFKFRLQTLLNVREQSREQARIALANALGRLQAERDQADQVQHEMESLEQHMRSTNKKKNVEVDRLLRDQIEPAGRAHHRLLDGHRHQLALKAKLSEIDAAIGQASEEVERCREKLVEADRQVQVLEKLYEKQLDEHNRKLVREEAKQLDEAAIVRARRAS